MKEKKKFRYVVSDMVGWLLYHIIKYRKDVVAENISRSFPERKPSEIEAIVKDFYYWFSDLLVEITFGESALDVRYKDIDVLDSFYKKNKSVIIVASHFNNWEALTRIPQVVPHKMMSAYQPLKNRHFDRFIKSHRERYGMVMVTSNKIFQEVMAYKAKNIPTATLMLADQTPAKVNVREWITFLNQPTPVLVGPERIAKKTGHAVVYMNVEKPRRGAYVVHFIPICDDPAKTVPLEITQAYFNVLENAIRESPATYLWSHRRWKHAGLWREKHGDALPPSPF